MTRPTGEDAMSNEHVEVLRDALRKAFRYGETHWQQADSEYASDHRKAGETMDKFRAWADETAAAIAALSAPQPPAEAQPASYVRKRIAWELERTAMGDGYYGGALRAAKGFPEATPSVRSLLDRWATGKEGGLSDHTDLCAFALQIYAADGESPSAPVGVEE